MDQNLDEPRPSLVRKILPFSSAAVLIALLYVGYIFYSRYQDQKDAERHAAEQQTADARKTLDAYGGEEVKVLGFYATGTPVTRGESAQLCYSVANAEKVSIEPDVHEVPASYSNCVKVAPKKDTTYTLEATDKKGTAQQAVLTVRVQ